MELLEINMASLIETISLEDDNLGKSFLDTHTGEVIYIPTEVRVALKNRTLEEEIFDDWLQEFVHVAILISEDETNRYLSTPIIGEDFYVSSMKKYVDCMPSNSNLKLELNKALSAEDPMKGFKRVLMDKKDEMEEWYKYEDNCIDEFVRQWLILNGIELKYLN